MNTRTSPHVLNHYANCWFCTQVADNFVGQLTSHRFVGNKLTIIFSKMVRILHGDGDRWRATEKNLEEYPIEFEGCVNVSRTEKILKVRSALGDIITLTSEPTIGHLIDKLLSEGVAEIPESDLPSH